MSIPHFKGCSWTSLRAHMYNSYAYLLYVALLERNSFSNYHSGWLEISLLSECECVLHFPHLRWQLSTTRPWYLSCKPYPCRISKGQVPFVAALFLTSSLHPPPPWHMPASHPGHCIWCFLYQLSHQTTPHIKAMVPSAQILHVQAMPAMSCAAFVHFLFTKVAFYFLHLIHVVYLATNHTV